jgi:hypothetical protein
MFQMIGHSVGIIQQDGIIPPYNPVGTYRFDQSSKSIQTFRFFRHPGFDILGIGIKGKLKIVRIYFNEVQMIKHGFRVLTPEYDTLDPIRG